MKTFARHPAFTFQFTAMERWIRASRALALALVLIVCAMRPAPAQEFRATEVTIPRDRTGMEWADLNGDGLDDLIVADDRRLWFHIQTASGAFGDDPQVIEVAGGGALFDLADLNRDGAVDLVLLDSDRVRVFQYDGGSGKLVEAPEPILDGMRGVELQHLAPANFIFDIDSDGDDDLIYPLDGRYLLYFQEAGAFTMKNAVSTRPITVRMSVGLDRLGEEVVAAVTIPRLAFEDLNGDGRLDLRASKDDRESFYLQSSDGVIPESPSYEVDLSRFKAPAGGAPPAIGIAQFQFLPADLNGDGRRDYTIVSGNKIWIFKATESGVDFNRPDQIIKVSAETMTAVLLPINGDDRPDLVILQYEIPSMGRIVAGLAIGIRFEIELFGYNNVETTVFSRRPDYRSTMVFKVPPILTLLGQIEELSDQFREVGRTFTEVTTGDFNGDGKRDLLRIGEDRYDIYLAGETEAMDLEAMLEGADGGSFIREALFGEKRREVTLDTILGFITDLAGAFQAQVASKGEPSFSIATGRRGRGRSRPECRDVNGDGIDDIIVISGRSAFQTMRLWLSTSPGAN